MTCLETVDVDAAQPKNETGHIEILGISTEVLAAHLRLSKQDVIGADDSAKDFHRGRGQRRVVIGGRRELVLPNGNVRVSRTAHRAAGAHGDVANAVQQNAARVFRVRPNGEKQFGVVGNDVVLRTGVIVLKRKPTLCYC